MQSARKWFGWDFDFGLRKTPFEGAAFRKAPGSAGGWLPQEKLQERHGIKVSVESLRQWMIGDGQWKAKRGQNIIVHPLRKRRRQRQRQRQRRRK